MLTSWMEVRSVSFILSNSSIQQIPLSLNIKAPASRQSSRVSASRATPTVRPAAEDDLPIK